MPGTMLKFGGAAAVLCVAPAAAMHPTARHHVSCPLNHARAASGAAHRASAAKATEPTTAFDPLSAMDGWMFNPGRGSGILNP